MSKLTILAILIALAVVGGVAYWASVREAEPVAPQTPPPASAPLPNTAAWQTYRNEEYGFEFQYPPDFNIGNVTPLPQLGVGLWKLHPDRVFLPKDCGGFLAEEDEIRMTISILNRNNDPYNVFSVVGNRYVVPNNNPITIGEKTLRVQRNIPGLCEPGDEFLWKDPSGSYIVIFNINPSSTLLVSEYESIINSFRFIR